MKILLVALSALALANPVQAEDRHLTRITGFMCESVDQVKSIVHYIVKTDIPDFESFMRDLPQTIKCRLGEFDVRFASVAIEQMEGMSYRIEKFKKEDGTELYTWKRIKEKTDL